MNKAELVKLAKRACEKRWTFEQLKWGDDLYGKNEFADEVWDFVEERGKIGSDAFDAKYAQELAT